MFLSSEHAPDRIQSLAGRLGCVIGHLDEDGSPRPALLGSLSKFDATLKEFGARWHERERVYHFANWPMLEAALRHLLEGQQRG